mgnify:CR=1 FL=1
MPLSKFSGVALNGVSKVDGVSVNGISEINAVELSSPFANTKSLFTDGVNDFVTITLSSDIIPHNSGSISSWVKVDSSNTSTKFFYSIYDDSATSRGRIELQYFNTSGSNVFALNGAFRDEIASNSFAVRMCNAKTKSAHHGKPWNRIASDYGPFDSSTDSIYNANAMKGNWHHVLWTWNKDANYTYNSTTYNGRMTLYVDGVRVNRGCSSFASHNGTGTAQGLAGISLGTTFDKIRIGARFNENNDIDCLTDELAIFDGELDDDDAVALYNSGVPGDVSSQVSNTLVGWWRFEGDLNDSSTNGNNGVASNGATFSTDVPS